jgi:hypothetical protein
MKKSLFLYLFIFAVLMNIFTYMYFTNKTKYESTTAEKMSSSIKVLKDSLAAANAKAGDANYFTLENNDNAIDYYEKYTVSDLSKKIREGISDLNANPKGNPLTKYEPLNGEKFLINKVQILNHRWIIADFSNGHTWGEVLIKYFVNEDGTIDYQTIETLLHSNTVN